MFNSFFTTNSALTNRQVVEQPVYMGYPNMHLMPSTSVPFHPGLNYITSYPAAQAISILPPSLYAEIQMHPPMSPTVPSTTPQAPTLKIKHPASNITLPPPIPSTSKESAAQACDIVKLNKKEKQEIHKCTKCERVYFSYPALYTHNKRKHPNPDVPRKKTNRGRPKKNKVRVH